MIGYSVSQMTHSLMSCVFLPQFDSFFVSVGLRDRPELRERPVVVCHARGQMEGSPTRAQSGGTDVVAQSSTSEIASCNYVAREYGVKNGMSLGQAKTKCADVIAIPYDFKAYDDIAIAGAQMDVGPAAQPRPTHRTAVLVPLEVGEVESAVGIAI